MKMLLAITIAAAALTACSSMNRPTTGASSGNPAETKNSTDANKSANPAAVSPAGGGGGGGAAGTK